MEKESRIITPPTVSGATRKDTNVGPMGASQKVIIEISVNAKNAEMRVKHDPVITGIDRHKINYGLPQNQAAVLRIAHSLTHHLEKEGFTIESQK